MYKRFHDRFGTAGVVIGVIALIAALGGSAFAAGGLTKSQEKQVKKIAKKYAGKAGATGPAGVAGTNGTNGTNGTAGAKGDTGAAGSNGTNGTNGTAGANGKTVLSGTATPGAGTGADGDFYIETDVNKIYGPKAAGAWPAGVDLKGTNGTFSTEPLPSGETLTGTWSAGKITATAKAAGAPPQVYVPISFPIPLVAGLPYGGTPAASRVHYIWVSGKEYNEVAEAFVTSPHCSGTVAAPKADPGHLCIYAGKESGAGSVNAFITNGPAALAGAAGAGTTGAIIGLAITGADAYAGGTWAVTAE